MQRRSFLTGLLAAGAAMVLPVSTMHRFNPNAAAYAAILDSFPSVPLATNTVNRLHMTFTIGINHTVLVDGTKQMQFGMKNHAVDLGLPSPSMEDIAHTVETRDIDYTNDRMAICEVVRGSNWIAKTSRRGRGNRYAVLTDGILVWYQGASAFDGAVQRLDDYTFQHPDLQKYMIKLKFNTAQLGREFYDGMANMQHPQLTRII